MAIYITILIKGLQIAKLSIMYILFLVIHSQSIRGHFLWSFNENRWPPSTCMLTAPFLMEKFEVRKYTTRRCWVIDLFPCTISKNGSWSWFSWFASSQAVWYLVISVACLKTSCTLNSGFSSTIIWILANRCWMDAIAPGAMALYLKVKKYMNTVLFNVKTGHTRPTWVYKSKPYHPVSYVCMWVSFSIKSCKGYPIPPQ